MSTHTVTIHGIDLVYDKEGSGPPVVFIHGGNACALTWEAVLPHFLDSYTCFAYDQRGQGRSGRRLDGQYGMLDYAGECVEFLETVVGPAVIVGHSSGGATALGAAVKRPDLVRAVYLEDSVPPIYSARGWNRTAVPRFFGRLVPLAEKREREQLSIAQHAHDIGQLSAGGSTIAEAWPPIQVAAFARYAHTTDPAYYARVADGSWAFPDEFCDAIGASVRCPVHLAWGDVAAGAVVHPEDLDALRSSGMDLSDTHFRGAGHGIHEGFPREFIADLKAFLARIYTGVPA